MLHHRSHHCLLLLAVWGSLCAICLSVLSYLSTVQDLVINSDQFTPVECKQLQIAVCDAWETVMRIKARRMYLLLDEQGWALWIAVGKVPCSFQQCESFDGLVVVFMLIFTWRSSILYSRRLFVLLVMRLLMGIQVLVQFYQNVIFSIKKLCNRGT